MFPLLNKEMGSKTKHKHEKENSNHQPYVALNWAHKSGYMKKVL